MYREILEQRKYGLRAGKKEPAIARPAARPFSLWHPKEGEEI